MRQDGIKLTEGSRVVNLVVPYGDEFPLEPNDGEIFRRSDLKTIFMYEDGVWDKLIRISQSKSFYTSEEVDAIATSKANEVLAGASAEKVQVLSDLTIALETDPDLGANVVTSIAERVPLTGETPMTGYLKAPGFEIVSALDAKIVLSDVTIDATALIEGVALKNFLYKADETREPKVGFIADWTPSVLSGTNQNHMDVANCIGVLMKSVQELSARVRELEAKA